MEEALRAALAAASGVTSLVGTRIDWGARVQGAALPALVLNVISGSQGMTQAGPDGLAFHRVQVDAYADTYAGAKALSRAVIAALNGHRAGGFGGVFHVTTRDMREGGTDEADRPFRVSLDFETYWREP